MQNAGERAITTYLKACTERDPAVRMKLLEACFAPEGRLVTRSREIRGHAALSEMIGRFLADPLFVRIRLTSVIDAQGTTFRFRGVAERSDGTSPEAFDAGEIDASGRITLLLTFAGPLAEAPPSTPGD